MRLTDQQIQELQNRFLGKRISVPYAKERYRGVGCKTDFIIGTCEFIGYNPHIPEWGLQVTIERMPIENVDHTKIRII